LRFRGCLATAVKSGFGTAGPGENPPEILFLKQNLLIVGMIAQVSLKKYFSLIFGPASLLAIYLYSLNQSEFEAMAVYEPARRKPH